MATNARERTYFADAVAAQIRAERAAASMTREDAYREAGLSRSTWIRLETGERVADVAQLTRVCAVFGISLSEFFARVEARVETQGDSSPSAAQAPPKRGVKARTPRKRSPQLDREVTKLQHP